MKKTTGPFKIVEAKSDCENQADHFRNYDCNNYDTCLSLAAALDWDSFHCCECTGVIDSAILWQARQAQRRDKVVNRICDIPETINPLDDPTTPQRTVANLK